MCSGSFHLFIHLCSEHLLDPFSAPGRCQLHGWAAHAPAQKTLVPGLILYCCHLEILNHFLTRAPHFHFVLGPALRIQCPTKPDTISAFLKLVVQWERDKHEPKDDTNQCRITTVSCAVTGRNVMPGEIIL